VIGGGPAGAAAAAAAHAAGLEVTLYAAGPPPRQRAGESLPPGAKALVAELFGSAGFVVLPACGNRSAWGGPELETTDFMLNPLGPGAHVDRRAFDAALLVALREAGVRVIDTVAPPDVAARLLVDATGRTACVARSRGVRRRRLDRLVAAMWVLERGDEPADSTTTVEAVRDGWWYTSPVPGGRRIAAFLTDADLLPTRRHRPSSGWWPTVPPPSHIALLLAGHPPPGAHAITDASTAYLDVVGGDGWLATGDAAVSFDPLSSQGVVTALEMGREAGRVAAGGSPLDYAERYREVLRVHLAQRAAYYDLEDRWPDAPFWVRRQAPGIRNQAGMRAASMRFPRTLSLPSMNSSGPDLLPLIRRMKSTGPTV
jgi:flavin-dependent dehydrogenase